MSYTVVFSPKAEAQLMALYDYIASVASASIAAQYTEAIIYHCEALQVFPQRGTMRDDVRPGLRITHYKKRTVIAFAVDVQAEQVAILGLFYGGQNFEYLLQDDDESFAND